MSEESDHILMYDDVDHRYRVEFIPVRDDGVHGVPRDTSFFVRPAAPRISSLQLVGDLLENCEIALQVLFDLVLLFSSPILPTV